MAYSGGLICSVLMAGGVGVVGAVPLRVGVFRLLWLVFWCWLVVPVPMIRVLMLLSLRV